ncbi:MAG: universal stress protein [Ktedonobacteraceae bacterium]
MNKRILLGIETDISPATQRAIRTVCEIMEQPLPHLHLVLLHVIPLPAIAAPSLSMYVNHMLPESVNDDQRNQAEEILRKACVELQTGGIASEQIELLIRVGLTADEIVKAAGELHVSYIVIGSQGNTWWQNVRRFLVGSTSRRVLRLARCPVMIVPAPQMAQPGDLVKWYEEAIMNYLQEHPHALTVFTPREVARKFVPPTKKAPGRKEMAAATLALEQLTGTGMLCRHDVKGELKYVND